MKRRWMLLVGGSLLLTLLAPFQASAAEAGSPVTEEGSRSGVTMVKAGSHHSLALKDDGTVWQWGGIDSTDTQTNPVQVEDLDEVVSIDAGSNFDMALKSDGTLWAWGSNEYGNIGINPYTDVIGYHTLNQVLSSVTAFSAGSSHSLAVKSDGTVWAWGLNVSGQLGNGTASSQLAYFHIPAQVKGLDSVTAVAAGSSTSIALRSDGTVWTWGGGYYRDDPPQYPYTPVQVQGLSSIVAIIAGSDHNLALRNDGTVWAWECSPNSDGCQEANIHTTPMQAQEFSSAAGIANSSGHHLELKRDGTVWAWGKNDLGQLGDGTYADRDTPAQVRGLRDSGSEAPTWLAGDVLTTGDVTYNLPYYSVQLNWQPASDESRVDKYFIYQGDSYLRATLNGDVNSYEVTGLTPQSQVVFSIVALDADGNLSDKREVTVTIPKPPDPVSFQLSDAKTYTDGQYNYLNALYYGYISSPGQVLVGYWSPPYGYHGVVTVSMISPDGEKVDLGLATENEYYQIVERTTVLANGTAYGRAEVYAGESAKWTVKAHNVHEFSPDKKITVYVSVKYDNH